MEKARRPNHDLLAIGASAPQPEAERSIHGMKKILRIVGCGFAVWTVVYLASYLMFRSIVSYSISDFDVRTDFPVEDFGDTDTFLIVYSDEPTFLLYLPILAFEQHVLKTPMFAVSD
jgi:hypothetical protein